MNIQSLPIVEFTEENKQFRMEVRQFLQEELEKGTFETKIDSWMSSYSREFSEKLGKKGWIGMTYPKEYGGAERSSIERYIVIEELLAFGAPVAGHWFADRQQGPLILRYGTEEQKRKYIPGIIAGKSWFSIGLSEPNSGSDLASLSTNAKKTEGGYLLNGQKIWTSGGHLADYIVVLCRTAPRDPKSKHKGMSQVIVDLKAEGVTIRPIKYSTGEEHFNEIFFDNVFIPDSDLLGVEGNGWQQGLAELAYERSGPERILSTFPLLEEIFAEIAKSSDLEAMNKITDAIAEMMNLRLMSLGVAQLLEENADVSIAASLVKDLGTIFEQLVTEVVRIAQPCNPSLTSENKLERLIAQAILHGPGITLRGGTTEILRGIVAKGLIAR